MRVQCVLCEMHYTHTGMNTTHLDLEWDLKVGMPRLGIRVDKQTQWVCSLHP